jgi:hypothetical protein
VTKLAPKAGPVAGGTAVTITGGGFAGASVVHFGATAATSFTVKSGTSISAIAPASTSGIVDVTVTGPGGTSATTSADLYKYKPPTVDVKAKVASFNSPKNVPADHFIYF